MSKFKTRFKEKDINASARYGEVNTLVKNRKCKDYNLKCSNHLTGMYTSTLCSAFSQFAVLPGVDVNFFLSEDTTLDAIA